MNAERDVVVEKTVAGMHRIVAAARARGITVGCIPTMGYLHDGHAYLIRAAAAAHGLVVVSIFVNPTQFGPGEDFERYPRDLARDLDLVAQAGGQVVFAPTVEEMYPTGAKATIHLTGITDILEGAHRPGHFDGVATVVSRWRFATICSYHRRLAFSVEAFMAKSSARKTAAPATALLIATRKGLWMLAGDARRTTWKLRGPHFLGHIVHHAVLDPRDGKTLLVAARTGHLGHTVMRSTNRGRTWAESKHPPVFDPARDARSVDHVFWLSPGHADEPGVWYAGTSPQGLFRSEDGGQTWQGVDGFNHHPRRKEWCGGDKDGTPDGPKVHSIIVDPRDANHLYLSMSGGGTFESTDRGADWKPLNKGVLATFYPDPYPEYGQDPHCVRMHPAQPDRLYQQNHCGIFRLDRPSDTWIDIGKSMPKKVGNIGFPMTLHPRDLDTAWVFPMDGSDAWPRTAPGGKPAVYRTVNGGRTWQRQDRGFPAEQAWWTVKRQAMTVDAHAAPGLYLGTTSGEIWASRNGGESWKQLAGHLPQVYAVEACAWP